VCSLDDVVHEPLIAALPYRLTRVVPPARSVVAEVVQLVDNHEVVVAPIEGREVDVRGIPALPAEIGMAKNVVAKTIYKEGIQPASRPARGRAS
jgi:hypothetical protein